MRAQNDENVQVKIYYQLVFNLDQNVIKLDKGRKSEKGFLYFAVFTTCLVMVSSGAAFIWTSPMLPLLKSDDPVVNPLKRPLDPHEQSLIAGLVAFGGTIGALAWGKLADLFGRKNTLVLASALDLASFVALAYGDNVCYYYISRFVQGNVFGFAITILPLYIAEITEDRNRGKFGSFVGLSVTVGYLYGYAIGPFFGFRYYSLLCGAPLAANVVLFALFVPESPVYLASIGDRHRAKRALKKFRDVNAREVEKALLEIERVLRASTSRHRGLRNFFRAPGMKRALAVSVGVNVLQQASGISAVLGFLGPIFELARLNLSGNASAILVAVVQLLSVLVSMSLIERLGRRVLLLTSTLVACLSLFVLGFYFYLVSIGFEYLDRIALLPFVCMVVFVVGYGFGLGPVPVVVTSEVFLNDFKSLAASISMFSCGIVGSLAVFGFPLVSEYLGVMWCFWTFSAICALGVVFVWCAVPETKGKSLLEIQNIFIGS